MEHLKSIWNKTLSHNEAARLQVCCCERVTLVSSGVLGKACRVWGLCAWNCTLNIPPASSAHTQLCKLDMDYGGASNTALMVPAERQVTRDIKSEVTDAELQKCFKISSGKTGSCRWQGTPVNRSGIQLVGPTWSERLTKHTSWGALRTSCVTSPSPVFCTGHVSFFSLIVRDC